MRSFRSKPVGWQNESYRHYLAAKGVKTYLAPKWRQVGYRDMRVLEKARGKKVDFFDPEFDSPEVQKKDVVADIPDYVKDLEPMEKKPKKKKSWKVQEKKKASHTPLTWGELDKQLADDAVDLQLDEGLTRIKVPKGVSKKQQVKEAIQRRLDREEAGLPTEKAQERIDAKREFQEFLDTVAVDSSEDKVRNKAVREAIKEIEDAETAEKWSPEYLARKYSLDHIKVLKS